MNKRGKIRTSIWIDPKLILLLNERGIELTRFISLALPAFLELPEDPTEQIIQEKARKAVLRLRSTYEKEVQEIIKNHEIDQKNEEIRQKPVKMIHVFDNSVEEYRDIPEDQYDPKWMVKREKVRA